MSSTINATETIRVDFGNLSKHGIFRYFFTKVPCGDPIAGAEQPVNACPQGDYREYDYSIKSVKHLDGSNWKYDVSNAQGKVTVKIGDGDVFISGEQDYVITYTLRGIDASGRLGESAARELIVSEEPITGGLYYWNAGGGSIDRFEFGVRGAVAERFIDRTRNLYRPDWDWIDVRQYPCRNHPPDPRPKQLEELIAVAEHLAAPFEFLRVDCYLDEDSLYVGELTPSPGAGYERFEPASFSRELAGWWTTPVRLHPRDSNHRATDG